MSEKLHDLSRRWSPKSFYIRQYWPLNCTESLDFEDLEIEFIQEKVKFENGTITISEENWKQLLYKFLEDYLTKNLSIHFCFQLNIPDKYEKDESFLTFMNWKFGLKYNRNTKTFEL